MKSITSFLVFFLSINVVTYCQSTGASFVHPDGEVYTLEETGPVFPGCENLDLEAEQNKCSEDRFRNYLLEHMILEAVTPGTAMVATLRMVVEPDGSISNIELPSCCCVEFGEQLVKAAEGFNYSNLRWIAGQKDGENVRSHFEMEVIVLD